jgi:hypothetical protein
MHLATFDAPGHFRCTWPLSDAPQAIPQKLTAT